MEPPPSGCSDAGAAMRSITREERHIGLTSEHPHYTSGCGASQLEKLNQLVHFFQMRLPISATVHPSR